MTALLVSCLDSSFKVSYIVKCVKNSDDVNTVCDRLLNEILNEVVSIVTVAEHILSSEQHLQLGVGHLASDYAKSLPWVFVEKSDT